MPFQRIREIPYNYTSFSDREIIIRFLGEDIWEIINELRTERKTGRSARMLFEVLGDMWVITRNPFLQDDLLANQKRRALLLSALRHRLERIRTRAAGNQRVFHLLAKADAAVSHFEQWLNDTQHKREQSIQVLKKITDKGNIAFDGLSRVSHVTDASDWRVEYPFVVLYPDTEAQVQQMVAACKTLGLAIIPRGGGTGYTGGAIPLKTYTAIINTEKLENITKITHKTLANTSVATIAVQAGVVTRRVAEVAEAHNYVFAVDPTSQDASCIGGNIAMNAGGKKAVIWGTTLDNLYSWKMVTADAKWLEVTRLEHNLGKIHLLEMARFQLNYYAEDGTTLEKQELLEIPGKDLRKQGLGKDVTNKFLGGLPGIQKEGCDGIITSAIFILHTMPRYTHTLCLEFFGELQHAVPAIVEVKALIDNTHHVALAGLEHLDERYIKAVGYSTKSARRDTPKMILLADIVSEDEQLLHRLTPLIIASVKQRNAEGFIAITAEARKKFWLDRARTAAIAAHTNAFKINEDVVIPLDKLAQYSAGIERINIEQSIKNKIAIIAALAAYLEKDLTLLLTSEEYENSDEANKIIHTKQQLALDLVKQRQHFWQLLLDNLDTAFAHLPISLPTDKNIDNHLSCFQLLQNHQLAISYHEEIAQPLQEIFSGQEFIPLHNALDEIYQTIIKRRLFVATHMHAGDGNVHTNIPVHSNDYLMLQEAEQVIERIMQLACSLGGVISGEHGIGITKLQFLDDDIIAAFSHYKQQVDPDDLFNPGKLRKGATLENAYTPSLRLLEQEALILEASELGELNHAIKDCLRCGKCKPVCNTHIPRANLLYSPRNKILASGLIIEAFLYEEQTRRGVSIHHFDEMQDIADHCTICHKCLNPCPVNIDFGDVSVQMRNILQTLGKKRTPMMSKLAMLFLNRSEAMTIKILRKLMIEWGYKGQRFLHKLSRPLLPQSIPSNTTGKPQVTEQIIQFVKYPMPEKMPMQTMRALLHAEDTSTIPIICDPQQDENAETVFYFPGCGSERLFSQVGLATLAMLHQVGVETVLPPGYLCCGYPQTAGGDKEKGQAISIDNQVLFHRMANTLNYKDIKTVIVSCGTCMDQLQQYRFKQIFPDCRLLDIHEFLMEKGIHLKDVTGKQYIYHDPCHTPMKVYKPLDVSEKLLGQAVQLSNRCCGEAGTLAVSRPDISSQIRFRKENELLHNKQAVAALSPTSTIKVLTSCPACQQGLSRYSEDNDMEVDYIVVELAVHLLGKNWQQQFIQQLHHEDKIEYVLL